MPEITEQRFKKCYERWQNETAHLSSIMAMRKNASYQEIVSMGEQAIPWILNILAEEQSHIMVALYDIVGETPTFAEEDKGNIERMTQKWLQWGQEKGYYKVNKLSAEEEHKKDTIEMREEFRKFMEGATEITVFGDGVYEWDEPEEFGGGKRQPAWMDVYFSHNDDYMSPLCVVSQAYITGDNEFQDQMKEKDPAWVKEDFEDGEWDISIDDKYVTKENTVVGVRKWIQKYHPYLAHLPVRYEDEDKAKKYLDQIWGPIQEDIDYFKKEYEAGNVKTYTLDEIKEGLEQE